MPRTSVAFFAAAVVYALIGMALGMYMAANQTFILSPVHAHINLLGWVSLAIMGGFYALAGDAVSPRLAWANFAASNLGAALAFPALALHLLGDDRLEPAAKVGWPIIILGMLLFGAAVVATARRPASAA